MKVIIKYFKRFAIPLLLLSLLMVFLYLLNFLAINCTIQFKNLEISSILPDGILSGKHPVTLPLSELSTITTGYIYTGNFDYHPLSITKLRIIPDDDFQYIKINGNEISLAGISPGRLKDWNSGFVLDIGGAVKNGNNTIEMKIGDHGGRYGLNILNAEFLLIPLMLSILIIIYLTACALSGYILRKLRFDWITIAIFSAGIIVHLVFLTNTKFDQYSYDLFEGGTGHINYIEYVATNYALPRPDIGWAYYHPPLYYISAAIVYKIAEFTGIRNVYKALQSFSMLYYFGFLIFGLLFLRRVVPKKPLFYLSAAMLLFWPSGFIHAIRIGNDTAFYLFFMAGLYFSNEWYLSGRIDKLYWATIIATLCFITKTNGIVLFGIISLVLLAGLFKEDDKLKYLKKTVWIFLIFLAGFSIGRFDNYYYALKDKNKDWIFAGLINTTSNVDGRLYVENKPLNYLYFDIPVFLNEPYISTRDDKTGRQYFWNFLIKSGFFGEFTFPLNYHRNIAFYMSLTFLFLILNFITGSTIWAFLKLRKSEPVRINYRYPLISSFVFRSKAGNFRKSRNNLEFISTSLPRRRLNITGEMSVYFTGYDKKRLIPFGIVILNLFIFIILLILNRIKSPLSCLADFRYVYPVIISFIVMNSFTMEYFYEKKMRLIAAAGFILSLIFIILSGMFFVYGTY